MDAGVKSILQSMRKQEDNFYGQRGLRLVRVLGKFRRVIGYESHELSAVGESLNEV